MNGAAVVVVVLVVYCGDGFDDQHVIGYLAFVFSRIVSLGSMSAHRGCRKDGTWQRRPPLTENTLESN